MAQTLVNQGKTKRIFQIDAVRIENKDDLTAGNGEKHDVLAGKAIAATTTACRVFEHLKGRGVPVAYYAQDTPTSFIAPHVRMLPFEVVIRREAHGSWLRRHPEMEKGQRFEELVCELFLKTSGKRWGKHDQLECDDPLLQFEGDQANLFNPDTPTIPGTYFLSMPASDIGTARNLALLPRMEEIAKQVFLILEEAWAAHEHRLVDFKVEFGTGTDGTLLLADVIDNDSWRLISEGQYVDKQAYRDNGDLQHVLRNYKRVARLTEWFARDERRRQKS